MLDKEKNIADMYPNFDLLEAKNSYISKDEFINMLNNLRFTHIEKATIHFITGFIYDSDKNTTNTRGFDFEIY